jgi:hypothetical protein
MKNFGGAMDLSSLGGDESGIVVAAWLVPADQNTLREYLALSEKVPVLMLIRIPKTSGACWKRFLLPARVSSSVLM